MQVAQIIGKPDLAPAAWVKRLVTLCDHAPPTPANVVRRVLEAELGQSMEEVFERFDLDVLGSASIAQVTLSTMSYLPIFYGKVEPQLCSSTMVIFLPLHMLCSVSLCVCVLIDSASMCLPKYHSHKVVESCKVKPKPLP